MAEHPLKGHAFCPHCYHALSRAQIELAVADFLCPDCRLYPISRFFSYGSPMHRDYLFRGIRKHPLNGRVLPDFPKEGV